jgi:hypothetical protein
MPGLAPGDYTVTAVLERDLAGWLSGAAISCGSKSMRVSAGPRERRVLQLELCSESPN